MKFPWEKQNFRSIEIFWISELFPAIFSQGYFFIKKLSTYAIHAAKTNDVVYCTCEYFTKTNTSDSWIVASREQSAKYERYCPRTRLEDAIFFRISKICINNKNISLLDDSIPFKIAEMRPPSTLRPLIIGLNLLLVLFEFINSSNLILN